MEKTFVKPVLIKSSKREGCFYIVTEKYDSDTRFECLHWDRVYKRDVPYHLYFVAPDAKIVNGDYVYVEKYPQVWEFMKAPCPMPYWGNANEAVKIVATTDKSLGLPLIPKTVVNQYIIRNGKLDTLIVMGNDDNIEVNSDNEIKMIAHGVRL